MERRQLMPPPPQPIERRPLAAPVALPVVRRSIHPVANDAPPARHPMAGMAAPPVEDWPDRVYGYHPLMPDNIPVCIRREVPGYSEVTPEVNPLARNREMGIDEALAEAIIRAAWLPNGHAWSK